MLKTIAATITILLLFLLFHAQLKAFVLETRTDLMISRLGLDADREDQLEAVVERVADGYSQQKFSAVEIQTIHLLLAELREGDTMSDADLDVVVGKFNALLRRHGL
ncbi:MAG: hypothetical protein AAGN66_24115 [Acidobacteriota bacterium]